MDFAGILWPENAYDNARYRNGFAVAVVASLVLAVAAVGVHGVARRSWGYRAIAACHGIASRLA